MRKLLLGLTLLLPVSVFAQAIQGAWQVTVDPGGPQSETYLATYDIFSWIRKRGNVSAAYRDDTGLRSSGLGTYVKNKENPWIDGKRSWCMLEQSWGGLGNAQTRTYCVRQVSPNEFQLEGLYSVTNFFGSGQTTEAFTSATWDRLPSFDGTNP